MEIIGIGTDIVECVRIARMVEDHGELFLQRVYTPREVRYCQERKRSYEHFAGRGRRKRRFSSALAPAGARGCAGRIWRFATMKMAPRKSTSAAPPRNERWFSKFRIFC